MLPVYTHYHPHWFYHCLKKAISIPKLVDLVANNRSIGIGNTFIIVMDYHVHNNSAITGQYYEQCFILIFFLQ